MSKPDPATGNGSDTADFMTRLATRVLEGNPISELELQQGARGPYPEAWHVARTTIGNFLTTEHGDCVVELLGVEVGESVIRSLHGDRPIIPSKQQGMERTKWMAATNLLAAMYKIVYVQQPGYPAQDDPPGA